MTTAEHLAELVVGPGGVNVQRGQLVEISSDLGKEELTRAVARAAYRRGAKFVEAIYWDPHVKRARLEHAEEDTLEFVPAWLGKRVLDLATERAASILLSGPTEPGLFDDLDPLRVALDRLPSLKEYLTVVNDRTINWAIIPGPNERWAQLAHPDLSADEALSQLWEDVAYACRLDADDPGTAWQERLAALGEIAAHLDERRFDALDFEGPGTELRVGLFPSSRWETAAVETVDGVGHIVNLPSEEVFTAPDPARVHGVVRATMPVEVGGVIVEGISVRFEDGHAVQIDADRNADVLRRRAAKDEGASRLGEVALVDREGRVGQLGLVFFDTLLDENAASHVAMGNAYDRTVGDEDRPRANQSEIHVDFMIGGDDVAVTGITESGDRVPVLRDGRWQL
ncbi:MAG TPA: aminopeptidase [Gaiellaceae bacterium]|nr:aminopeptidase [Gaiellaceae bacterium]